MDDVLADTLTANLKSADTDAERMHAITLALIALVDCQRKTAERVKRLVKYEDAKAERITGAKWALRVVWGFGAGGGFAILVKGMKLMGVL